MNTLTYFILPSNIFGADFLFKGCCTRESYRDYPLPNGSVQIVGRSSEDIFLCSRFTILLLPEPNHPLTPIPPKNQHLRSDKKTSQGKSPSSLLISAHPCSPPLAISSPETVAAHSNTGAVDFPSTPQLS
ncbi:unnamed protein product [Lactuca virosa]|uniref:Uncharacterized protein n=1 Tax=Lactuca virosa TaxID=75947 RepID=A0AAU9MCZ9_9ASTR|nr:unnamed protein product [Lactuca virosa]CAH1424417.1 unnamed protein product [Lactuca virosa]